MKNLGARSSIILGLGAAALMLTSIACGSSGGTTGTGGSAGGATGAAGSSAAGATGAAGATAGSTGAAGKTAILDYTFDDPTKMTQGWSIQTYVDSTGLNLGAKAADAGVPDGGTYPMAVQADGVGVGGTGALKVTAHFDTFSQYVEILLGFSPPKDLTGAIMHAQVNVIPPTGATSFLGGAFIYAKSGQQYVYSNSMGAGLTAGAFTTLSFDFDTATAAAGQSGTFMPSMIQEIGIHIYADSPFDGGTFTSGEYTFYIDNVVASK
jgi:hypothetical protein